VYFSAVCTPVQHVVGRATLRSAHHGHLIVPALKTKTFGSHSFRSTLLLLLSETVLPSNLLDINISRGQFACGLKTCYLHVPTRRKRC